MTLFLSGDRHQYIDTSFAIIQVGISPVISNLMRVLRDSNEIVCSYFISFAIPISWPLEIELTA
jgi:hypothetical protein